MIGFPQRSRLLDFLFAIIAFPNENRPRVCDLWIADGFQFLDPNRVILQLIVASATLLRARSHLRHDGPRISGLGGWFVKVIIPRRV